MRRLNVPAAGNHLETAVAPFMPDGRQEHGAVLPVRGEDRQQTKSDQISEIVHGEVPAHMGRLTGQPELQGQ